MNTRTLLILLLALATLARIWLVLGNDVTPQNAYFFLCSERPSPAYHDGPGGTAMVVRAAAAVAGDPAWWLLGPIWALTASLACWRLALRTSGEPAAALGTIALNLLPSFNAASLQVGPDLPALTFALLGLSIAWDALRRQNGGILPWAVAAAAFASGTLFAYWVVLAGLVAAALPFLRPKTRRPANIAGSTLVVVALAAALAPAIAWNASEDWVPVAGWTPRGLTGFDTHAIAGGLVHFGLGVSPLLAFVLPWTLWRCMRASIAQSTATFAAIAAAPLAVLAALFVYRGWDAGLMALPPASILLAPACALMLRAPWVLGVSFVVALAANIPLLTAIPAGSALARQAADHALALDERLADKVEGNLFLIGSDGNLASAIGYHLRKNILPPPGHPLAYRRESQGEVDQFTYWPSYDDFVDSPAPTDEFFAEQTASNPFVGHSAIYVGTEPPGALPQTIRAAFSSVEPVQEVRDGNRRLYIYLCLDYQTLPL